METINVYIDGACLNNGKKDAIAGYGVYFGENDPRNESGRVEGKQTNNTGELTAFIRCLEILQEDIYLNKQINIYTDSEYVIKCATTYGTKIENKTDVKIPNLELVKKAHDLFKNKFNIKLNYIRAHTGNIDIHSIGNAEADKLANNAANIKGISQKKVIKLNIPYENKDKAKKLGAKWNITKKYWYVDSNNLTDELLALQEDKSEKITKELLNIDKNISSSEKIYLNVPFAEKNFVKNNGAKWDSSVKKWYYTIDISQQNKEKLDKYI